MVPKEKIFENHICNYLKEKHKFNVLSDKEIDDNEYHFVTNDILNFIKETQKESYDKLFESYKTDSDEEILRALREEVKHRPLWLIIRNGFDVRGIKFQLYASKPRSKNNSIAYEHYKKNIFSFKQQFYFDKVKDTDKSIDIVLFLNGLPIITIEVKHEDAGQNYNHAIEQYLRRDKTNNIFKLPFLHIASDTSDVKVATDIRSEDSFQWFNASLKNQAETKGEYPIEHLYSLGLSKDLILEYIEFYLVYVSEERNIKTGEIEKESFSIFPRFHQLRSTDKLSLDITKIYEKKKKLGKNYLIWHSAGAGKTLTISWMADKLNSLFDLEKNKKIYDLVFVLTDRKSLDKNVKDDLLKFKHIENTVEFAKKSKDLADHINKGKSIIVTTIQKFAYIQELISKSKELKKLNVAFLIDEAHRSNDGKLSKRVEDMFIDKNGEIEKDTPTYEDEIQENYKKLNTSNLTMIAFTATPTPKTIGVFGKPFDTYSEAEAIQEKYIVDVASNIISYETLYNIHSEELIPDDKRYPKGIIQKALKNIAYRDEELIQYKSELMINFFQKHIMHLLDGKAKSMVVASSRPAGLIYFNTLNEIIKLRGLPIKILYAFSDYTDEKDKSITEDEINNLSKDHNGDPIEDVFDKDEYRIMVVANKFQTGFSQSKLVGMFLDKPVNDVNAVQTLSRLNRSHVGKEQTLVVDFTNNVENIFSAFNKYRLGISLPKKEPNPELLNNIYKDIVGSKVFSKKQIEEYIDLIKKTIEDQKKYDPELTNLTNKYSEIFLKKIRDREERKEFINLLNKFSKSYIFIIKFYELSDSLNDMFLFTDYIADKLIKEIKEVSLMKYIKNTFVGKGSVKFKGQYEIETGSYNPKQVKKTSSKYRKSSDIPKVSINDVIEEIKERFNIPNEEALIIRNICSEKTSDKNISDLVTKNKSDKIFLESFRIRTLRGDIIEDFYDKNVEDRLTQEIYTEKGGVIDFMSSNIINLIINNIEKNSDL